MENKDFSFYTYELTEELPKKQKEPIWRVIQTDNKKVVVRNIFKYNWLFKRDVGKLARQKGLTLETFSEKIRNLLMYYYWGRCEYEIIVSNWVGLDCEIKIDAYTQIAINWENFITYCWNNLDLLKKLKVEE